jgi:hypothetical protein
MGKELAIIKMLSTGIIPDSSVNCHQFSIPYLDIRQTAYL